jgi:nucleotide-binding universal stress UspA family protein
MTRLLIGYDGSEPATSAIDVAAALFGGAEAIVATVFPPPPTHESAGIARVALPDAVITEGIDRMRAEAEGRARETAEAGAKRASDAGLQATAAIHSGLSAWRVLRTAAAEAEADVIVAGTRGDGVVGRILLGATASSLLHHADRPVLVVPAGAKASAGPIYAGYDDSDGSRAALRFAAEHLREHTIRVAHAWRSPTRHTLRGQALTRSPLATMREYGEAIDDVWREVAQDTAAEGAELARELGLQAQPAAPESGRGEWHALLDGAVEADAAARAHEQRGRGAIASTVLGSVASGLVHAAALPVIVVPS